MRYLPINKFTVESRLSQPELIDAINSEMEESNLAWLSSKRHHKYFQGYASHYYFRLNRIIHYRNSFLPIIEGNISSGISGSTIAIKMGLHGFVIAFMSIWLTGAVAALLAVSYGLITQQIDFEPILMIPFFLVFLGWALPTGAFWYEAKQQKPELIRMFNKIEANQRFDPIVITPGDSVKAQGTQAHP